MIMLQTGANALLRERGPDRALEDTLAVIGPQLEVGCVRGVRLLGLVDDGGVGKVQDRSVTGLCFTVR